MGDDKNMPASDMLQELERMGQSIRDSFGQSSGINQAEVAVIEQGLTLLLVHLSVLKETLPEASRHLTVEHRPVILASLDMTLDEIKGWRL